MRVQYLRETATTNRELDGWMTFGQIKKHYGGDDEAEELAAELTKRKRALGLFRRHPDMPDIEKATLFWVMKEMDQSKTETDATRFNADRSLEVDGDTLKYLGSEPMSIPHAAMRDSKPEGGGKVDPPPNRKDKRKGEKNIVKTKKGVKTTEEEPEPSAE